MGELMDMSLSLPWVGIDGLLKDQKLLDRLKNKRVGLLANQASLSSQFIPSAYALHELIGPSLTCLFTAEHGWSTFCAAGKEIDNEVEPRTQLPVYSLYGSLFDPNVHRLQSLDVLIIDIQDVGVRCYTYVATCAQVIEHASLNKYPLEVIVADRPNPLGSHIRGPFMDPAYRSLVSYIDVPFQHGKTIGALLQKHNSTLKPPLSLITVPCDTLFQPAANIWVPPSPGLPDWESVFLYPGLVLLEGTNVSEGRGTSLPFKCVAAPKLDSMKLIELLKAIPDSGIAAHALSFTPSTGKLAGQLCQGIQIHITDYTKVDAFSIGVHLLHALFHVYPLFEWAPSGQGYWIDKLMGTPLLRTAICEGKTQQKYGNDLRHDS
jgi:uncharacterized protein YbbC (DUF1343 family)